MDNTYRLELLDHAIRKFPESPVNYLLRGEFWMEQGDFEQASDDLFSVLDLAEAALHDNEWGYIYQSYIDRAKQMLHYLEHIQ